MASKIVYNTADGVEVITFEDQVTEGLWHLPAGSTETKPPSFTEKQTCQFIDSKWVVTDIPEPEPEPEPPALTFADKRRNAYGLIGDQLDVLFHDMTSGKGDKTGEWYKAIKKVKADNPKK